MKPKYAILYLLCAFVLIGCGGGSGSDPTSSSATGTVALTLTDGPIDGYQQMNITVSRVLLLSPTGQVVVYEPEVPETFNLLDLRPEGEEDAGMLLAMADVPAGTYDKIRLEVAPDSSGGYAVEGVGVAGTTLFRLPSGHIDFNPRGRFTVTAGATLNVTLDIDCEKSVHISAGNQKNFRPVVFVDIDTELGARCPRILKGEITDITYADDKQTVTGFELTLPLSKIQIPILVDGATVVLDDAGNVTTATAETLKLQDRVAVRARLESAGLKATLVVVGEVKVLEGVVTQSFAGNQFALQTQEQNEEQIEVMEQTQVSWGCNSAAAPEDIRAGLRVRVVAKERDGYYQAVAVLLSREIEGSLGAVQDTEGGVLLTVTPAGSAASIEILLPADAPIQVQFDGVIMPEDLKNLVNCMTRNVRVILDPTAGSPTAVRLVVIPERLPETGEAAITAIDAAQRTLTITGEIQVKVSENARIIDVDFSQPNRPATSFSDLKVGDQVILYGFELCAEPSFEAKVVVVTEQK